MNLKLNAIILCILFGISFIIYPDTIILKDGKKITGTQIERNKKNIKYKDNAGKIKTIPIEKIKSVTIDKKSEDTPIRVIVEPINQESKQNFNALVEKVQELYKKIETLTEKNKEQDEQIKAQEKKLSEFSEKETTNPKEIISSKENKPGYLSNGGSKSIHTHPAPPADENDEVSIELTHEEIGRAHV